MLCYNYGVQAHQQARYSDAIMWLERYLSSALL
jgi:hypothetical protein